MTKLNKRKCKQCGEVFQKTQPLQMVCSPKCGFAYAKAKREKKEKKDWKAKKKVMKENIMTYSQWVQKLQVVFNEYIRYRDYHLPCISCGIRYGQMQAGHFFPVGNYPAVRFNEDNCHKQCAQCNNHKGGNLHEYRPALINKIGSEKFLDLENAARNSELKLQVFEIKDLISQYKAKTKILKQDLGL